MREWIIRISVCYFIPKASPSVWHPADIQNRFFREKKVNELIPLNFIFFIYKVEILIFILLCDFKD